MTRNEWGRHSSAELAPNEPQARAAEGNFTKVVCHPAVSLLGVALAVAFGLRALFFSISDWLWRFASNVDLADVAPWARWAMADRDGAEAYGLFGAVAAQWLVTALCMWGLARLPSRARAIAVLAMLACAFALAWRLPPIPPIVEPIRNWSDTFWFVLGCLFATWLFGRLLPKRRVGMPLALAVFLVPLCFVPATTMSLTDATTILAPALRLHHGFSIAQIYFQYDLLPSLVALALTKIGGQPIAYSVVVSITFYALFFGIFVLARRLFRKQLVMPLLVCLVVVRFYAILGGVTPQVTPIRLDLWVLPLSLVLAVGLRHWSVGLLLGALFFFSRSIGTLYIGAYALTVAADFLSLRLALPRAEREPWLRALPAVVRGTAFVWGPVLVSLLAARAVFGSITSDAVRLYQHLGLGMMRIDPTSFYWLLLALTGGVGWLACSRRAKVPPRIGEATIFAVALMVASSTYFFGRSHEHNLLNVSAPFLFCTFLALDLAWPTEADGVPVLSGIFHLLPWLMVATCAYFYWNRAIERISAQFESVITASPILQSNTGDQVSPQECAEIANAAGDDHVYLFSSRDFWYYYHCKFVPRGYVQPVHLAALKKPLVTELKGLLAGGYKIVLPRPRDEFVSAGFNEIAKDLPPLDKVETTHFEVYRLRP